MNTGNHKADHPPDAKRKRKEPATWQLYVPLVVTILALIALLMWIYGFVVYVVR